MNDGDIVPEMSGIECVTMVNKHFEQMNSVFYAEGRKDCVIRAPVMIAASSSIGFQVRDECLTSGFSRVESKPISPLKMKSLISECVADIYRM